MNYNYQKDQTRHNDSVKHSGDVQLCFDMTNNAPVFLPYEDRFLHTLILGDSGWARDTTMLSLINQDIENKEVGVTVIDSNGTLSRKAAMMAEHYGRTFTYFDPSLSDCPFFNPLIGKESDVVENITMTFRMLNPDSPKFFLDLNEQLIRNAIKVLKRMDKAEGVDGRYATFINLSTLLQNTAGKGRAMVQEFSRITARTLEEAKENADITSWFLNVYFAENSKIYENTSGVRSQVAKLVSNKYLREVLNPDYDKGERNQIDFDRHLAEGGIICISTVQGALRDLSKYLGYFIILQLQSAAFRRSGNENTLRPNMIYIDDFHLYFHRAFSQMLTQTRSYRLAFHLATPARAQVGIGGGYSNHEEAELEISLACKNVVLYHGCSKKDAEYYSGEFGEQKTSGGLTYAPIFSAQEIV